MKTIKIALLLTISLFAASGYAEGGDPQKGKELSATCVACHGPDGNSVSPGWPKLAGQHQDYIVKQLLDYKAERRVNAIMYGIAATLGEQDMRDLAAYFSSQQIKYGTAKPELVTLGEKIYRSGIQETGVPACMACHGPAGKGMPGANYPAMAGQHAEYTSNQLKLWKSEERNNDSNAVMRTIAGPMTSNQIEAVSSYIQGLR